MDESRPLLYTGGMSNNSQTSATIITELRALMARRRVTQAQLAEVLDCSAQTITRRMTGEKSFTIAELDAIAGFLDVPITALFTSSDPAGDITRASWSTAAAPSKRGPAGPTRSRCSSEDSLLSGGALVGTA
jgi:DNA-binding XRE family transcriptional regulator